ncbi:aldehyde dehydrogenase family protein [Pseudonocardia pini]|uniref:aldehyde dehydrogenase family protein n=1 Tax=Pseudonocardia pini TaxID=2758030 RepID=UPI0015F04B1D|nr:aldehyde dehydrogenase family protein [Pseudonocardia pini]
MATTTASPLHDLDSLQSFVDGDFVEGVDHLDVHHPATDEPIARVSCAGIGQVERAILAARRAFDEGPWPSTSPAERAAAVLRMIDHLEDSEAALVDLVVAETGCPRRVAGPVQVRMPLAQARESVSLFGSLPDTYPNAVPLAEAVGRDSVTLSVMRHAPVGVVVAVSAYNFPLHLALWKVLPALLAGNTVILRPSPLTPLTALALARAGIAAGLPRGVLNVVVESGTSGAQLMTTHPAVDVVSFTGSTAVGRAIAAQAAPTLKRVLLELGGKSVGLYLPGSLDRVGAGVAGMMANHAGQACVAQSRVLVPREFHGEAIESICAAVRELRLGDPNDPETTVGPLAGSVHARRVVDMIELGRREGAAVVAGGGHPSRLGGRLAAGNYVEPTVLDCPDQRITPAREEIFGPVVCVLAYDDPDHAVALANDSSFALSAGVYGDPAEALAIAVRLDAGTVAVNRPFASAYVSSGGWKQSGIGRERGIEGLRAFQRIKHLAVSH